MIAKTCGISKGFLIFVSLHYNLFSVKVLLSFRSNCEGFLLRMEIFMSVEKTLSIIKPDAVKKNVIGEIYTRFEKKGLKIVAAKMLSLTTKEAESFYKEHKERPFFNDLVKFMTSGPVMVQVLEGENAVIENRNLMGATDPKEAGIGTIRADFATSIDANAVHGSDSIKTARQEINFFFPGFGNI